MSGRRPIRKAAKTRDAAPVERDVLERTFEGRARLAALLAKAGSVVDPEDVAAGFRQAQAEGLAAADVIPDLFEGEPRFARAQDARALYGNLLGLWDLLARGATVDLSAPPPRPPRAKKAAPPPAPRPFAGAPDEAYVEAAWRYLEECPPKERTRLAHAFENRQDALLNWLDLRWSEALAGGAPLTDEGFGVARQLLQDACSVLHLGLPRGVPALDDAALEGDGDAAVPGALAAWLEEQLFEACQDEAAPLGEAEAAVVRRLVDRGARALWAACT